MLHTVLRLLGVPNTDHVFRRLSYGVMHRLPRVSPDLPIQYKQFVIPPGVSESRVFDPVIFSDVHSLRCLWVCLHI